MEASLVRHLVVYRGEVGGVAAGRGKGGCLFPGRSECSPGWRYCHGDARQQDECVVKAEGGDMYTDETAVKTGGHGGGSNSGSYQE